MQSCTYQKVSLFFFRFFLLKKIAKKKLKTETILNMLKLNRDILLEVYRFAGDDDVKNCRETCKPLRDASETYIYRDREYYPVSQHAAKFRIRSVKIYDVSSLVYVDTRHVEKVRIMGSIYSNRMLDLNLFNNLQTLCLNLFGPLNKAITGRVKVHSLTIMTNYQRQDQCQEHDYRYLFPKLESLWICMYRNPFVKSIINIHALPNSVHTLRVYSEVNLEIRQDVDAIRDLNISRSCLLDNITSSNIEKLHIDTITSELLDLRKYKKLTSFSYNKICHYSAKTPTIYAPCKIEKY